MSRKININATTINCYDENGVIVVGLGDDAELAKKYLIIS